MPAIRSVTNTSMIQKHLLYLDLHLNMILVMVFHSVFYNMIIKN